MQTGPAPRIRRPGDVPDTFRERILAYGQEMPGGIIDRRGEWENPLREAGLVPLNVAVDPNFHGGSQLDYWHSMGLDAQEPNDSPALLEVLMQLLGGR